MSLLQTEQSQLCQLLLISPVLQTPHQLHCPSLDTFHGLDVFLMMRGPKLNTVLEGQPHQYRIQTDHHFPAPAGHTISDTSQDATVLLVHLGSLLAHIQPSIEMDPQVRFLYTVFQLLCPTPGTLPGVAVAKVHS